MSELKAIHFMTHFDGGYEAFYPKDEADKVIAEKDTEIAKLKEERRWHKCSEELPQNYEEGQSFLVAVEHESTTCPK